MRKELSKQEYRWLAELVRREKLEAEAAKPWNYDMDGSPRHLPPKRNTPER
jgi:hypothetical protein